MMWYLWLLIPTALMVFREFRPSYALSPVITLSCMVIAAMFAREARIWVCLGFVFSVVGDFFLQNKGISPYSYLLGIGGFFLAHVCFAAYSVARADWSYVSLIAAIALLIPYIFLVTGKLYPALDSNAMRVAVTMYMLISIAAFSLSFSVNAPFLPKGLFIVGIGLILFSDTIIAYSDFLRVHRLSHLIMPTYYLCHIFVAASTIA